MVSTSLASPKSNHNSVNPPTFYRRQFDRQGFGALSVQEYPVWELPQPAGGTSDLIRGTRNRPLIPPLPCDLLVSVRPYDSFVTENDNVVATYDQQVTKLFTFTTVGFPPVCKWVRVGP